VTTTYINGQFRRYVVAGYLEITDLFGHRELRSSVGPVLNHVPHSCVNIEGGPIKK